MWEPEELGPKISTAPTALILAALSPRNNYSGDGENKGSFYFGKADGNILGIKCELEQIFIYLFINSQQHFSITYSTVPR